MLRRRADGKPVERVHPIRQVMWHLMPGRNQSAVFFEQQVDVGAAQAFAESLSAKGPHRVTLFHLVLAAAARTLHAHPRLNRFVAGRCLYQRNEVEISFSLKQSFEERAPILAMKRVFPRGETLEEMLDAIAALVAKGRGGRSSASSDLEVRLASRMPRPVVALVVRTLLGLDGLGLLPASILKGDPLFASLFVANMGSLGLDAGFHHLYEYGNIPIFLMLGRVAPQVVAEGDRAVVRPMMKLRYTFDERIEDGFAAARALGTLQGLLEDPEALLG
ncbi:MAG: 2-oxo acid dehydrogenase subunit E2 [Polyangia bacterium]|jgi:hypothetical protein|nr:2-oxo acid dehydrogenase subunit E2 [Polyangia bacterium]